MANKNVGEPDDGGGNQVSARAKDAGAAKPRPGAQGLDARSQEAIGRTLRAHYEDLVRAPVPSKFLEMLDRLEATEQSKPEAGGDESG